MDGDSGNLGCYFSKKTSNNSVNGRYIFLPVRLRPFVHENTRLDGFLLDYGFNILPNFGFAIYTLFLLF